MRHICMKAIVDKESKQMLCCVVLSYVNYMDKIIAMGDDIASTRKSMILGHFLVFICSIMWVTLN